ncbi:MAG TPA: hypothetical protein VJB39_02100 [Patescibacteria group bacterium]|nr:hypothetical protein [Patescibacteria group bacterium]
MWRKIALTLVISLVLLLVLIFLLPLVSYVNVFLLVIIWLSLARSSYKWYFVISGGLLLDVFFKTYGLNLLALAAPAFVLVLLEDRVSHLTILGKMSLSGVAIIVNLIVYLALVGLAGFFADEFFYFLFGFKWPSIFFYLITHLLLMSLGFLVFKPQAWANRHG